MLTHIKDAKNHWTVVIGTKSYQFDHTHVEYDNLKACVMEGQQDEFLELIDTVSVIENWSEGNFEFKDGYLFYEDEQVANQPTERIVGLIRGGHDSTKTSAIVQSWNLMIGVVTKDYQLLLTECWLVIKASLSTKARTP